MANRRARRRALVTLLLAAVAASRSAAALPAVPPAKATEIAVTYHGRIRDWRADGNTGIYVEGVDGNWYHADFMWSCVELPIADHVTFVTEPDGSLDRFSSIRVRGDQCAFVSLEPSAIPASRPRDGSPRRRAAQCATCRPRA